MLVLIIVGSIPVVCYLYLFGLGSPYGIKVLGWIMNPLQCPGLRL